MFPGFSPSPFQGASFGAGPQGFGYGGFPNVGGQFQSFQQPYQFPQSSQLQARLTQPNFQQQQQQLGTVSSFSQPGFTPQAPLNSFQPNSFQMNSWRPNTFQPASFVPQNLPMHTFEEPTQVTLMRALFAESAVKNYPQLSTMHFMCTLRMTDGTLVGSTPPASGTVPTFNTPFIINVTPTRRALTILLLDPISSNIIAAASADLFAATREAPLHFDLKLANGDTIGLIELLVTKPQQQQTAPTVAGLAGQLAGAPAPLQANILTGVPSTTVVQQPTIVAANIPQTGATTREMTYEGAKAEEEQEECNEEPERKAVASVAPTTAANAHNDPGVKEAMARMSADMAARCAHGSSLWSNKKQ